MHDSIHSEAYPFQPFGWIFEEPNCSTSHFLGRVDRESILIVDDEPGIRTLGKAFLSRSGYRVLLAPSGEAALELINSPGMAIDLMVLDLVMPGLSGQETLERLRFYSHSPNVLLSSGYCSEVLVPDRCDVVLGFLKKPYRPSHLLGAVRHCLEERSRRRNFVPHPSAASPNS